MINDKLNMFSDGQAITATAVSENVLDLGVGGDDVGQGEALWLNVVVGDAFAAAGAATLTIALQSSDDNSTFADVVVGGAIAKADLTAAAPALKVGLPTGLGRYLRLNYTVATGPFTAGSVSAGITLA